MCEKKLANILNKLPKDEDMVLASKQTIQTIEYLPVFCENLSKVQEEIFKIGSVTPEEKKELQLDMQQLKKISEKLSSQYEFFKELENLFYYNENKKISVELIIRNNKDCINFFNNKKIFPPIFYLDENIKIKYNELHLFNDDLKAFYLKAMNMWIKEEYPDHIKKMINEIIENYNQKNIYVTTISLFTLLEYRINKCKLQKVEKSIYKTYKKTLENRVFNRDYIYQHLFYYIDDIIFENTNKAEILTRHIIHGDKLDLINYESMMSLIFLYDFIDHILKIEDEN